MEEQQIQEFVHKALANERLRVELASNPAGVLAREGLSPRVERIISRLTPYLAFDRPLESDEKWWHV